MNLPPADPDATLPRLARVADGTVVLLWVAAAVIAETGGFVARVFGVRLSVTSGWRVLLWALVVLALRHAWIRRPSLWQRVRSYGTARIGEGAFAPAAPAGTSGTRLAMHVLVIAGFG